MDAHDKYVAGYRTCGSFSHFGYQLPNGWPRVENLLVGFIRQVTERAAHVWFMKFIERCSDLSMSDSKSTSISLSRSKGS